MGNGYDMAFYDWYMEVLERPEVRNVHDKMFKMFSKFGGELTLDLGCATAEYARYDPYHTFYAGFDLCEKVAKYIDWPNYFFQKDFVKDLDSILAFNFERNWRADSFVSLFATELHLDAYHKYELYKSIFRKQPSIQCGMVAGLYYVNRYENEQISEDLGNAGKFTIHQTVEPQNAWICKEFTEYRSYHKVPSGMLGDNVVEVWKIFERNYG